MTKPQIAVVGLEGSGKTVLMAVLAKRMVQGADRGYYLTYKDKLTLKYVETTWSTLNKGQWPSSTPTGKCFEYSWKLGVRTKEIDDDCDLDDLGGEILGEMRFIDPAGQDIRTIFGGDQSRIGDTSLPENLEKLVTYCTTSEIIVFIINIGDHINTGDSNRELDNQGALIQAFNDLAKKGRHIAIVFTQYDKYKPLIDEMQGIGNFIKNVIPSIYNSHVQYKNKVQIFTVAAVEDTYTEENDGQTITRPCPGFSSYGLDDLMQWMADMTLASANEIRQRQREEEQRKAEEERQRALIQKKEQEEFINTVKQEKAKNQVRYLVRVGGICLASLLIIWSLKHLSDSYLSYLRGRAEDIKIINEVRPKVRGYEMMSCCAPGVLWGCKKHYLQVNSVIINTNKEPRSTGLICVTCYLKYRQKTIATLTKDVQIGSGTDSHGTVEVPFVFNTGEACYKLVEEGNGQSSHWCAEITCAAGKSK